MSDTNYFAALSAINVNDHIEKKGGFSYLSWPYAVSQLRLADPTATWEVRRFDGRPYLLCEAGVFVEVAVTVQGITLSQIHPVLDARNRPIPEPDSFAVNTSIQRCLVKAIALHGLGLYIYAGEDTTPLTAEAANEPPPPVQKPATAKITRSQQLQIQKLAVDVGVELSRVLAYFGVRELQQIEATDYQRVLRSLEKRRAA